MEQSEEARAEQFQRLMSKIEHLLGADGQSDDRDGQLPFGKLISRFERNHPYWKDGHDLRKLAQVRNVLVHHIGRRDLLSIPTADALTRLETIHALMQTPTPAVAKCGREVTTLSTSNSLMDALALVDSKNYSQFPIYDSGQFCGILTENNIASWLASVRLDPNLHERIKGARVSELLEREPSDPRAKFFRGEAPLAEVLWAFHVNPALEVAILTDDGNPDGALVGIATQWDALELGPLTA